VSIDKDMLQIPGLSYSWIKKEHGIVETSAAEGDRMHFLQMLVGDTVDNYTGCPGIGPKKAEKFLNTYADATEWSKWNAIVDLFKKKGLDEEYALTQARVSRILRSSDWNPKTHEVKLWQPRMDIQPAATASCVGSTDLPHPSVQPSPQYLSLKNLGNVLKDKAAATLH
jgi:DNA polymerase-1